jgi:zeaxanthin glucosyltransferase
VRIVFKIYPQRSHYNATFGLARHYIDQGHEVIYAGIQPLQKHVEAQGFTFHVEPEDFFPYVEQQTNRPKLTFWEIVRHWREIKRSTRILRPRYARGDAFTRLIRELQPDEMMVDSPYTLLALTLYRHRIPFSMLESMMNLNRAPGCPPLDTTYVPTGSRLSNLWCELHWRRYFVKRWMLGKIGLRADFDRKFVLKLADSCGVDRNAINFDRYFHIGLRNRPEILLSPQELDFPQTLAPNQRYFKNPPDLDREETSADYAFGPIFERMKAERKQGIPLVYCSLGTAGWRYKGAERFLQNVIRTSAKKSWNLIVSIGETITRESMGEIPPNVGAFRSVPQLKVLKNADLMITHGGMNSIRECAALNVPMIVCPGTKEIDQAGNAARVVFWKRGKCTRRLYLPTTSSSQPLGRMCRSNPTISLWNCS